MRSASNNIWISKIKCVKCKFQINRAEVLYIHFKHRPELLYPFFLWVSICCGTLAIAIIFYFLNEINNDNKRFETNIKHNLIYINSEWAHKCSLCCIQLCKIFRKYFRVTKNLRTHTALFTRIYGKQDPENSLNYYI